MKNRILDHFGLKVLSLVIAFVVWILVANVDDYKTTKQISGIEIEFVNGNAITEKNKVYEVPEGTAIDVVVKGRRKIVENLTSADFKAVADLSKMSVTNAVTVEVSPVNSVIARELTVSYTNNAVVVAVESKIEKQLPVMVRATGTVQEGYAVRSKSATPNLITVKGAESVVNLIEGVAVDVNVTNANRSMTSYAAPVFLDKNGSQISSDKFEYDESQIEVFVEILPTKELDVKLETTGEAKEGYIIAGVDYQPTSIQVVGNSSDLEKVDEILINDIDVEERSKDFETSVDLQDYLPDGITLADDSTEIMVKVRIEPVYEKKLTISTSDINLVGKKEGYTYTFKKEKTYTITVRGLKDNLSDLKVTNMIPNINVTEYGAGIYSFMVNFREIKGVQVLDTMMVELEITQDE